LKTGKDTKRFVSVLDGQGGRERVGRRRALNNADDGATQNSGVKKTIRSWIDEVRKRQRYLSFCSLFFLKVKVRERKEKEMVWVSYFNCFLFNARKQIQVFLDIANVTDVQRPALPEFNKFNLSYSSIVLSKHRGGTVRPLPVYHHHRITNVAPGK